MNNYKAAKDDMLGALRRAKALIEEQIESLERRDHLSATLSSNLINHIVSEQIQYNIQRDRDIQSRINK